MKVYKYDKSRKIMERASKVIPCGVYGHLGPAEGCMIPVDAFPICLKAEGAYFGMWTATNTFDFIGAAAPMFWDITTPM